MESTVKDFKSIINLNIFEFLRISMRDSRDPADKNGASKRYNISYIKK